MRRTSLLFIAAAITVCMFAACAGAQDTPAPALSIPVVIDGRNRVSLDLYQGDVVRTAVARFCETHSVSADYVDPLVKEVLARLEQLQQNQPAGPPVPVKQPAQQQAQQQAQQAQQTQQQGQQQTQQEEQQQEQVHAVPVTITLTAAVRPAQTLDQVTAELCEKHGLDYASARTAIVPQLYQYLRERNLVGDISAAREKQAQQQQAQQQQAQQQQAQQGKAVPLATLSVTVDGNSIPFEYYAGQDMHEAARQFCSEHNLSEQENVGTLVYALRDAVGA